MSEEINRGTSEPFMYKSVDGRWTVDLGRLTKKDAERLRNEKAREHRRIDYCNMTEDEMLAGEYDAYLAANALQKEYESFMKTELGEHYNPSLHKVHAVVEFHDDAQQIYVRILRSRVVSTVAPYPEDTAIVLDYDAAGLLAGISINLPKLQKDTAC